MKKLFLSLVCMIITVNIFSQGIDFNFSSGQFGFAYSDSNDLVNYDFSLLDLNWTETFTGFGIGMKLIETYFNEEGYYSRFFPITFYWTPLVFKHEGNGYLNIGIYDSLSLDDRGKFVANNIIGLRFVLSAISTGRTPAKDRGSYNYAKSLYLEYDTTYNVFRAGIRFDYANIFFSSVILLFNNTWGPSQD